MASATSSIINQTGQNIWLVVFSSRSKTIRSLQKKIVNSISCLFVIVDNRDKILKNEKLIRKPHTNLILGDVIAYDISNVLLFAQICSDDQKTLQFCSFYGHEGNPSRLAQLTEFNFSMDHCLFLSMHIHFQMACLISKFSDFKLDEWR